MSKQVQSHTVCSACKGQGQTHDTETITVERAEPLEVTFRDNAKRRISLRTIKQGSGCKDCLGTGIQRPIDEVLREELMALQVQDTDKRIAAQIQERDEANKRHRYAPPRTKTRGAPQYGR